MYVWRRSLVKISKLKVGQCFNVYLHKVLTIKIPVESNKSGALTGLVCLSVVSFVRDHRDCAEAEISAVTRSGSHLAVSMNNTSWHLATNLPQASYKLLSKDTFVILTWKEDYWFWFRHRLDEISRSYTRYLTSVEFLFMLNLVCLK